MCGHCKKYAAQLMEKLLIDIQEKRKAAKEKIKQYLD
jgi:tryptophanyl-tRNA synthetase